ncbi:MAG: hypothetical protein ACTS4U_01200 [Candidatus Hodgkinia cicadicola]
MTWVNNIWRNLSFNIDVFWSVSKEVSDEMHRTTSAEWSEMAMGRSVLRHTVAGGRK